jgi:hypothetical protein
LSDTSKQLEEIESTEQMEFLDETKCIKKIAQFGSDSGTNWVLDTFSAEK